MVGKENISNSINVLERIIYGNLSKIQKVDESTGFFAGGHNGPYYDIESPVRNTAHWLVTYTICYMQTGDPKLKTVVELLSNYLMETKFIKYKTFIHRQKKDWANGVIGQAWAIEALNIANKVVHSEVIGDFLAEIGEAFTFSDKVSAWARVNPRDGGEAIDYTLNHQLWYAACLVEAFPNKKTEVEVFLDRLHQGAFRVREDGLICHLMYCSSLKGKLLEYRYKLMEKRNFASVRTKEIGYHLFNLYPLARIYKHVPHHAFFGNIAFRKSLDFVFTEGFLEDLVDNKYSYPYNAPAFEFPLVKNSFQHLVSDATFVKGKIVQEQMEETMIGKTYQEESDYLSKGCPDPLTLTSRIYEYVLGNYYHVVFK